MPKDIVWLVTQHPCGTDRHRIGITRGGQLVFEGHRNNNELYTEFVVAALGGVPQGCGGFLYTLKTNTSEFVGEYLAYPNYENSSCKLRVFEVLNLLKRLCRVRPQVAVDIVARMYEPFFLRMLIRGEVSPESIKAAADKLQTGALSSSALLKELSWRLLKDEWNPNRTVGVAVSGCE